MSNHGDSYRLHYLNKKLRWITPSIFQAHDGIVVDEWTLCEKDGNAKDILEKHWDNWVTVKDFQRIKDAGFNTVRIPIGCTANSEQIIVRDDVLI